MRDHLAIPVVSGPSADGGAEDVLVDPSTGIPVFRVAETESAAIYAHLERAREAAREWGALAMSERARCLAQAAERIAEDTVLVEHMTTDVGKPIGEARAERARAQAILKYYAGLAQAPVGSLYEDAAGELVRVCRYPRGVAALITPWNFPLAIPTWKLAPALLAGNAVVLKPAPAGTRVADRLIQILHDSAIPPDVCVLVTGDAKPAEELLSARPNVVSFTGSREVGTRVAERTGRLGIPVQLEMGGQNAVYVSEFADAEHAAAIILAGAMSFAGQKCTATSRAVVHHRRVADLMRALSEHLALLPVGSAHDENTVVGPMISAGALNRALTELAEASKRGIQIDAGGKPLKRDGHYLTPTLISGGAPDDRLYREELFAPVVGVRPVASFAEGLAEVNATAYGLAAGIVSPSRSEVETFARSAEAGIIRINAATTGLEPHVPFGGSKASSMGPREQGQAGLDFFSETRTIYG